MHLAIDISGPTSAGGARVLTREALAFAGELEDSPPPAWDKVVSGPANLSCSSFHNARRETRWTPNPLRPSPRR